jgi:1-acyl-sn-glycerol-3-phosphate acyltransferase
MLSFLPPVVRGVIAMTLLAVNTLFWCSLLFAFSLVKFVFPATRVRAWVDPVLNAIATSWIAGNSGWMRLTQRARWDVAGLEGLEYRGWYMVNCNHQSWVDIFVLQHLLNKRIPMLKFFLKQQLLYVPVMGLAWWALDFPFMRRHSDAYLKSHPEKRFEDLETTRRACEKFAVVPTSVMNFAEGTRFTKEKHRSQRSPYRHLLKPRAGALALALSVLGDKFRSFLDVTIVYPDGAPTFWQFLCGKMTRVDVRVRRLPIPPELGAGSYALDAHYRKIVQGWLQELWHEKDRQIDALLQAASAGRTIPAVSKPARASAPERGRASDGRGHP